MSLWDDNMSVLNSKGKKKNKPKQTFIFCIYTHYNNMNLHSPRLALPLGYNCCSIAWVATLPQIQIYLLHKQFKSKYASRED